MISEYINLFGWKWTTFMLIIFTAFIQFLWVFRKRYNTTKLPDGKKLQLFGILALWWGVVMIFMFTIITFPLYHQDLDFYKRLIGIVVLPLLIVLMIWSWLFDIFFRKKINNKRFTDEGVLLLIYGILSFIGYMFYYLKWLA